MRKQPKPHKKKRLTENNFLNIRKGKSKKNKSSDPAHITYEQLVLRNAGYVSDELQDRIRKTRLLIAGCGIGSTIAEAALRLGFEHLTLVDGDKVEVHNLNRQDFEAADAGTPKVKALLQRLLAINPSASIRTFNGWVTPDNAHPLVNEADLVLDTIDFLSLEGITALHDASHREGKPIISAFSAGWGAAAVYFPPGGYTFRELFGLAPNETVKHISYVKQFAYVIDRIRDKLSPEIINAMQKTFAIMDDGRPCPAPHVSAGSMAVASLVVTMAVRLLRGLPVRTAPHMILVDFDTIATLEGINLLPQ